MERFKLEFQSTKLDVKSNDLVVEIKRYAKREGLPKVCGTSPL
jgi:hypothetical protein